jgi:hypothetical protein
MTESHPLDGEVDTGSEPLVGGAGVADAGGGTTTGSVIVTVASPRAMRMLFDPEM